MITNTVSPRVVMLPSMRLAVYWQHQIDVPMHTHEEMELVLVIRGKIQVQAEQISLEGKRGDLFILPGKMAHNQTCQGPWRTLCVLFSNIGGVISETPRTLDCSREPEIRSWFAQLASLYSSKTQNPGIVCNSLLLALLSKISHLEGRLKSIEALPPRMGAALRFLEEHASSEVDTNTFARAVGTSYSRLNGLFHSQFGCSPLKYHQNLRMSLAKKLLLNPYASIDEIADQTGFLDTNYFCRLFRKVEGMAPGKWRKTVTEKSLDSGTPEDPNRSD